MNSSPGLHRQLRDFAIAAGLAMLVASAAFVAVRNRDLAERQIDLARRAAETLIVSHTVLPTTHAAVVSAAKPSQRHPFLRHREIFNGASWRTLGGTTSNAGGSDRATTERASPENQAYRPDDKLFYDAANRFDREGPIAELLHDGSGRALVVDKIVSGRLEGLVVAITEPTRPAPYPLLVMIGVLGLGAALVAAGALVGDRGRTAGTLAGIATLAVPTLLWHAWIAASVIVAIAAVTASAQHGGHLDRVASALSRYRVALTFLTPAAIAMLVLVAAPFLIGIFLGFYDHHHGNWTFVGIRNFTEILSGDGRPLDDPLNFWFILGVTVLWTLANVAAHVTIGVLLALLLSRKWIFGRGVFRMLLILPWAIPNYITALIWKGMFEGEYGAINSLLHAAGLSDVSWFGSWAKAFSANVITNTWLGFPFMMVVALGALETIPKELYEAAAVDGASAWQRFRHITLPHLRPALGPAVALGSIWTFNMFNVIYLVSAGRPGGSTNILVTDAYRWAFERGERYGMAAAYATIIFLVLLLWTVFGSRIVRSKDGAP